MSDPNYTYGSWNQDGQHSAQPQQSPAGNLPVRPSGGFTAGSSHYPYPTAGGFSSTGSGYTAPRSTGGAYTWNAPAQQSVPAISRPKKKKSGGKTALKILAGVLACAVISMGSVGAFAWMIRSGMVDISSPAASQEESAAFVLPQEESDSRSSENDTAASSSSAVSSAASPTITGGLLSAQEVAAKVTPSVVLIQNYQSMSSYSFYDYFYGYGDYGDDSLSPVGEGSGIIISKDGYIVTNQHVVDGAERLTVVTNDGISYEAELIGEDTQTDLAVIKINADVELTPAEFGSSEDLVVADEVIAIGNPGGSMLASSVTFGRVSALNRPVTNSETGYTVNCIQTDAAINPGNSGGALVDMHGLVVGINSSKIVDTEFEGLGFAIPTSIAQPVVSDLIEYGYVKDRAAPGFTGQYVDSYLARWYGMSAGYYVTSVTSDEAQEAGLQRGDLILAVDDTQITSANTFQIYLTGKKPGDTVTLTVQRGSGQRGSQTLELTMTLPENTGKSGDSETFANSYNGYSYYG